MTGRVAVITTVLLLSCRGLFSDPNRIIALQMDSPAQDLTVGDTVSLQATAITANGDAVPEAPVFWAVLDTGQVGFTLDTASGFVPAMAAGNGRVQARVENLRSDPLTITVTDTTTGTPATAH